jgi:hypothetical protein
MEEDGHFIFILASMADENDATKTCPERKSWVVAGNRLKI